MSNGRTASATAATRVGSGAGRLVRAWRTLPHERRLAAYAAIGLFLSLFLPWYQRQFFVVIASKIQPASDSQTAWGAFSFVEAAILLVAAGVLVLLFQRAEGKAFHLPGGDGGVITAAGVWSAVLIIWRIFDKQGGAAQGQNATTYGIEWGIFVALAIAIGLIYAGSRIRAAHRPEPPLPGENDPSPPIGGPAAPAPGAMPVLEARIVPAEPAPRESALTETAATYTGRSAPSQPERPKPGRARRSRSSSEARRSRAGRLRSLRAGRVRPPPADRAVARPRRRTANGRADGCRRDRAISTRNRRRAYRRMTRPPRFRSAPARSHRATIS